MRRFQYVLALSVAIPAAASLAQSVDQPFEVATLSLAASFEGQNLRPWALAVGDIDGDGHLDALTAYAGSSGIRYLRGDGAGGFEYVPTNPFPRTFDVLLEDFNGDALLDRAVSVVDDENLQIAFGNGDGTFAEAGTYPVAYPYLASADLDGDGDPDLLCSNDGITALYNNGDGTFTISDIADERVGRPRILDLDGDGDLDIAVGIDHGFRVYLHDDGQFVPLGVNEFQTPRSIAAGDINGDGVPDVIVMANPFSPVLKTYLGVGDGTFTELDDVPDPRAVGDSALYDANGDGWLDLVVSHVAGDGIAIRLGDGAGGFLEPVLYKGGKEPRRMIIADVNGDGQPDAVTADFGSDTATTILGRSDGTFAAAQVLLHRRGPSLATMGDIDGDGDGDIASTASSSEPEYGEGLFIRGAAGYDTAGVPLPFIMFEGEKKLADMDGDGLADLLTISRDVYVAMSNGDGTFADPAVYEIDSSRASRRFLLVDDIDADGDADVVHLTEDTRESLVFVLTNNGDGTLSAPTIYDWGEGLVDPHLADLNGDGFLDFVANAWRGGGLDDAAAVSLNQGDGTFGPVVYYVDDANHLTPLDADGDGDVDIVRLGFVDRHFLPNDGDGTFGTPVPIPQLEEVIRPVAIDGFDADGDGWQDIIVTGMPFFTSDYSNVYLLRGGPDGFGEAQLVISGDEISHFTTGDSNGDGLTDLIVSDFGDDSVAVVLAKPRFVCPADLDGDGALTIFDFLAFGNLFDLADPRADFDGDGAFTIFDFLAFQNAFDAGCR